MCNLIKTLLTVLILIGITHYDKSFADNADVVVIQSYKARFTKTNLRKEKLGIEFIKIPKYREIKDTGSIYRDVLEHSQQKPFGDESGRNINVHETAHGIHSDVRNKYEKELKTQLNAFYCLDGNVILLKDPKVTMRHVVKYVPSNLRSYRWNLYFVDQLQYWDDKPTYILEEWVAYILGSKCAVDDAQKGIVIHKSDAVSGCLDFSIYAVALAMTVKNHDPEYWENYPDFKEMIRYNLIQAEKTLGAGLDISEFNSEKQDLLYSNLLYSKDGEEIRQFLIDEFDSIFVD
jgi:hypothetical protein